MKKIFMAFLCLFTIENITAQEKEKQDTLQQPIQLNQIVVEGQIDSNPVCTTVINNYEEEIVQPKNIADLFDNVNGVSLIKRGNYAIDPSFRANQYEQLNVMYDGGTKVMHACPNRMDPITTHVIPEEVEKIEIVRGPFTVRYGNTFGGIVNFVIRTPSLDNLGLHGKASAAYETNGGSFTHTAQLQQVTKKYDLTANYAYRDFGNYEDGNGTEIPSAFRSIDYGIRLGINPTEKQRIQLNWRQSFGRDVLHAGLPMDTDYDNSQILSGDYSIQFQEKLIKKFTAKAYYSYVDHLMTNYNRPSFMMMEGAANVEATTVGGKLELELEPQQNWNLFVGIDGNYIGRDGGRNRIVKMMNGNILDEPMNFYDKIWQDSFILNYGLFAESRWQLSSTSSLTAGLRWDLINSDIQDPADDFAEMYDLDSRTENLFSGTISYKKQLSSNASLEVAYGRGTRAANMIERFINHSNIGQDAYEYIGNPDLDAEVNNQFEIGLSGKWRLNAFVNRIDYSAAAYYSFYENYIVAKVDESLTRKFNPMQAPIHPKVFTNIDNAYKTGAEIGLKFYLPAQLYLATDLAYVYTRNDDWHEALPLTPPLTAKLTAGIDKAKFWSNIRWNLVSEQTNISESYGETETAGYGTVDWKMGYKFNKYFNFGIAALNIFDKEYYNHLNFTYRNQSDFGSTPITEPGFNLTAFMQVSF